MEEKRFRVDISLTKKGLFLVRREQWFVNKWIQVDQYTTPDLMKVPKGRDWGWTKSFSWFMIEAASNLCEDEGCPNHGTPHCCLNQSVAV